MPNGLVDGALIVDTGLDNSGFFKDAKAFKAAVQSLRLTVDRVGREMGKSGVAYAHSVQSNIKASKEFAAEIKRLEQQAESLKAAIEKPGNSNAFKAVEEEIKAVEAEMEKAQEKRDSFINSRGTVSDAAGFSEASKKVNEYLEKLTELDKRRDALSKPTAEEWANYQNQVNAYNQVAARIEQMKRTMADASMPWVKSWEQMNTLSGMAARSLMNVRNVFGMIEQAIRHPIQAVDRLAGAMARMVRGALLSALHKLAAGAKNAAVQLSRMAGRAIITGLKKLGTLAGHAARSMIGIGDGARNSGKGFNMSLKNMLKYGLGIRSLFVLFNRLRGALKESFDSLSSYDPRVRASLRSLSASLNGLKGSLAPAFAPILTAVTPALTALINLLTRATNAVGMFMAALTGQSYYTAAQGVASIGDSATGSSGAVKELKRQLAGFDQLDILKADDTSSSGGTGAGAAEAIANYETVPVDSTFSRFVENLKDLFASREYEEIGQIIGDAINGAIEKAGKFISWDNLGPTITEGINAVAGIFNGLVDGINWQGIGDTFAQGFNTFVNTANGLLGTVHWYDLGANISAALNTFIQGVDWDNFGRMISEKAGALMSGLRGAVENFSFGDAGTALGEIINGFFSNENLWKDAGATIDAAINGLLDFTEKFVITFDEKKAAQRIKDALDKIKWKDIADKFWENVKRIFKKAGSFIDVLLGGEGQQNYDISVSDAINEKLAIKNGKIDDSSPWAKLGTLFSDGTKYALDWINDELANFDWYGLGEKVKEGLDAIDWDGIKDKLKDLLKTLFTGLGDFVVGVILGDKVFKDNVILDVLDFIMPGVKDTVKKYGKLFGDDYTSATRTVRELSSAGNGDVKEITSDKPVPVMVENDDSDPVVTQIDGDSSTAVPVVPDTPGKTDKGQNGDYTLSWFQGKTGAELIDLLNPTMRDRKNDRREKKETDKLTDALEDNTEATDDWKAAWKKAWDEGTPGNVGEELKFSSDWDEFVGHPFEVDVGVNFGPAEGAGGKAGSVGAGRYKNKGLLQYLKDIFSPGTSTEARVELLRQGWDTVSGWVSTFKGLQTIAQNIGLSKLWDTVSGWVAGLMGNTSVNQGVGLSKVWSTVSAWVSGLMGNTSVNQGVGLSKIWSTVSSWVAGLMGNTAVNQGVGLSKVWSTVSAWVAGLMGNTAVNQSVGLGKLWSTVSSWVIGFMGNTAVNQCVGLTQSGWTWLSTWAESYRNGNANAWVGLVQSGWSFLSSWVEAYRGGNANAWVGLIQNGWSFLSSWAEAYRGGNADAWVGLIQSGWSTLGGWASSVSTNNYASVWANLVQNWTGSAVDYLNLSNLTTTIKASLAIDQKANQVTANFSGGGTGKGVWTLATKTLGGIYQHGAWRDIPQYARGTANAGSLFIAGEAGPELVGHVGGRTEVLNKSQLASTMYNAVTAGMVTALRGLQFRVPAMATGAVLPYEVSAQIARSTADLQGTLDANNEDLIQTIISVAGQIVAAIQRQPSGGVSVGGATAQQLINEINRRTQMFSASPLKGV